MVGKDQCKSDLIAIPEPTLRRLPIYYKFLKMKFKEQDQYVSTTTIASGLGLKSIQVRKDLQVTGAIGKPKIGYHIETLITAIENCLGYNNVKDTLLVGTGHLGLALLGYQGFEEYGLNIVAGFDTDPEKIGKMHVGKRIYDLEKFSKLTKRLKIQIGIITTPANVAQRVCDLMVESGIKAIWNFAPVRLKVPDYIIVQNQNMTSSLAVLSKQLLESKRS
ncbi:redox-sensing transcriptional repressor Rex [Clostridium sp. 'deep sea']|uniref:redox-sensing transcriptional repressor Rex n=1 Tax=Clostridium sp. 'deep sea' TaxID=2779445 RepID=UPI0018968C6A|nr:redox-sensing transcriptional repressor Rex [Clostridium sp. 'deep sea']QOR34286.1 redox-sensing transcriptional repressor Rex [Clostridium sp. 'deep sea']